MAKYSSIRHVTCHSLFANDIETTNPKQKNKLYLDALSIDSNDSSILSYILLSGISNGNIPFIENLSYQIPKDQFDLKFLWKLPYPDATEFHRFITSNYKTQNPHTPGCIYYRSNNKYYLYFPEINKSSILDDNFLPGDQNIYRIADTGKVIFTVELYNKFKLFRWKSSSLDTLIPVLNQDLTEFTSGDDPIINFNTNSNSSIMMNKPHFIIVYKHSVVLANLHVSQDEKDFKLIVTNKFNSSHLKIYDASFYLDSFIRQSNKNVTVVKPILLSTDGNAYFYDQNFHRLYLKISSINKNLFKLHIFKNYCLLFNRDEFWVIDMDTFKPAKLHLNIDPLSIFSIGDNIFILATNSKVYSLTFKKSLKATSLVHTITYPLGVPLRLLPLHSRPGYSLVLSQFLFKGNTSRHSRNQSGLHLSIINNQTMQIISSKQICDIDSIEYVLMEPLIVDSSYEIRFPKDWFIITYRKQDCGSDWVLLNIQDGKAIQLNEYGQLDDVVTSIFTECSDFGKDIQVCMTAGRRVHVISLTLKKKKIIVGSKGTISTSVESWNIGGFFQNGILQLINPHHGLYYSKLIDGDEGLLTHALKTRPRIFGNAIITKSATKVWDPTKMLENDISLRSGNSNDNKVLSDYVFQFNAMRLLTEDCIERKDSKKIFCTMVDSENFVYFWDDVLGNLPNNTIGVRPILKFRPKFRIINITPILQNYKMSAFETKDICIPLFFLLGENGVVYVLSTLEDSPVIQPFSDGSLDSKNTLLEGNCASLWFEHDESMYVKHSVQLIQ